MRFSFALAFLALFSCAKPGKHRPNGGSPQSELDTKAATYTSLIPGIQDEDGFVETDKCDSVHWSALVGAVTDTVRVEAAFDSSGKLHRRPPRYPECYPRYSKSENSRDAFLMVLVYALATHNLDIAETVFDYAKRHKWVTGRGPVSRTYFTPNLQALYAQAIEHLGGPRHNERYFPIHWSKTEKDYEAHLQAMSVLAFSLIHGYVNDDGFDVLRSYYTKQKKNPFFAALYYRYSNSEEAKNAAIETLSNEKLFPVEHLPTSAERCEPWLPQRDFGPDWLPCYDSQRVHSGGDYLLTHAILTGRL